MDKHINCGCSEYKQLSRRQFLWSSLAATTAFTAPAWLPRVGYAQEAVSGRDVIISLYLRGGADGLSLCVPHGDDYYYEARPRVSVPRPDSGREGAATDLDGFFGLAPAMTSLLPAYQSGNLCIVHATGSQDDSRSHFDAQHFMEVGKPRDPSLGTGWLGRHLLSSGPMNSQSILRALAFTDGLPRSLSGGPLSLPVPDPDNFRLEGVPETSPERLRLLLDMYANTEEPLKTAADNSFQTVQLLDAIDFTGYAPAGGALYPESDLGKSFRAAAALIKADVGVEAIAMDAEGWDTHIFQGAVGGAMANVMQGMAEALAAFHADVISGDGRNVTVVVMSEFGRTVQDNASFGTDHGHGNAMFVLGGAINGGRVLTQWPGLAPEQRFQGQDLDVTIDYRDILAEILERRIGATDLSFVFPDYTPTFRGVTV